MKFLAPTFVTFLVVFIEVLFGLKSSRGMLDNDSLCETVPQIMGSVDALVNELHYRVWD